MNALGRYLAGWFIGAGFTGDPIAVAEQVGKALSEAPDHALAEAGLFRVAHKQYARQGRTGSRIPVTADDPRRSHYRPFGAWTPVKEGEGG